MPLNTIIILKIKRHLALAGAQASMGMMMTTMAMAVGAETARPSGPGHGSEAAVVQHLRTLHARKEVKAGLQWKSFAMMLEKVEPESLLMILTEAEQKLLAGRLIERFWLGNDMTQAAEIDAVTAVLASLPTDRVRDLSTAVHLVAEYWQGGLQCLFAAFAQARSAAVRASIATHLRAAMTPHVTGPAEDDAAFVAAAAAWLQANDSRLIVAGGHAPDADEARSRGPLISLEQPRLRQALPERQEAVLAYLEALAKAGTAPKALSLEALLEKWDSTALLHFLASDRVKECHRLPKQMLATAAVRALAARDEKPAIISVLALFPVDLEVDEFLVSKFGLETVELYFAAWPGATDEMWGP